jgi:oligopeptide transport system substrate-binding protein
MTKGDFQIGLVQWIAWVDDPIYTLNAFKSDGQELNLAKWENRQFQDLIKMSEQEINPFLRSSYLLKAEEILSEEQPIIPLFSNSQHALVAQDLHVIKQTPCGAFNIARTYFKKGD